MKLTVKLIIPLALIAVMLTACAGLASAQVPSPTSSPSATPTAPLEAEGGEIDLDGLVEALGASGLDVTLNETVEQSFFSVKGQIVKVNGEDMQVYQYNDLQALEADAALIGPDGTQIGNSMVRWMAPPHFYKSGKLLVLYLGESEAVLSALEQVLGEQFAGM